MIAIKTQQTPVHAKILVKIGNLHPCIYRKNNLELLFIKHNRFGVILQNINRALNFNQNVLLVQVNDMIKVHVSNVIKYAKRSHFGVLFYYKIQVYFIGFCTCLNTILHVLNDNDYVHPCE